MRLFKKKIILGGVNVRKHKESVFEAKKQAIQSKIEAVNYDPVRVSEIIEPFLNAENWPSIGEIDVNIDLLVGDDYRTFTVSDLLNAMRAATTPWGGRGGFPDWVLLFDIFANIVQDSHVDACIDTLKNRLQEKEFIIKDSSGEQNSDLQKLFEKKWFNDFVENVLNAHLYGFSLSQFGAISRGSFAYCREVNRKHVRPDLNGVVKQEYDLKIMTSWESARFKNWTQFVYTANLGKLTSVARWAIYKTEVARFWATFNQKFGSPPILAKTSLKDVTRKDNLVKAMKGWLKTNFLIIDRDDEIESPNTGSTTTGSDFYDKFVRMCDEQISKSLLGSTMVLDSGSSRSQSETHDKNTESFINSIARLIQYIMNDSIIPKMQALFLVPENIEFEWDGAEKLSKKEKAEIANLLTQSFILDDEEMTEFLGFTVEQKSEGSPVAFEAGNVQNKVRDYYKNLLNHAHKC